MQFSPEQDRALMAIKTWMESGTTQVFHLFGYAGTGKTTLAKHIAEGVEGEVLIAAYTGKAAWVLRQKGCDNACTIHSMIYHSRDKSRAHLKELELALEILIGSLAESGLNDAFIEEHPKVRELHRDIKKESDNADQPLFILNHESVVRQADLVIIDECSMVDGQMGSDLLSFGTPVLVLGDPAQLPPIGGGGFFTENITPNVMLEGIHRQAAESPIIRMATTTRNKEPLTVGDYGDDCCVIPQGEKLDTERVLAYDQLIVGKNKTRHGANAKIRLLKGLTDIYPTIGDRLVCLKNNSELGLLNGAIFEVLEVDGIMDKKVFMTIHPEDSMASLEVHAHVHHFIGTEDELGWYEKKEAQEFGFGYALTCHKSQGSQWKSVCVFDESFCFRKDKWRWLYTAITRAADNVTVVRM